MTFTESNTFEQIILDAVAQHGVKLDPASWIYIAAAQIPRQLSDVTMEPWLRKTLIHLNPEIAAQPGRADEVLHGVYPSIRCTEDDYHE